MKQPPWVLGAECPRGGAVPKLPETPTVLRTSPPRLRQQLRIPPDGDGQCCPVWLEGCAATEESSDLGWWRAGSALDRGATSCGLPPPSFSPGTPPTSIGGQWQLSSF